MRRAAPLLTVLACAAMACLCSPSHASEGHESKAKRGATDQHINNKKGTDEHESAQTEAKRALQKCYQSLSGFAAGSGSTAPASSTEGAHADKPAQHSVPEGKPAETNEKDQAATDVKPPETNEASNAAQNVQAEAKQPAAGPAPAPAAAKTANAAETHGEPQDDAAGQPHTEQPYELIRTLETIQDKIASGDQTASAFQRAFITDIASRLPTVTDEDWRKPKNSRAAIVYALSGGDPGVLTKLLSLSPLPCIDDNLIKGLIEYSQGHTEQAWELLSKFDPRSLDLRAAGHLALAQAILIAAKDGRKAMSYLDLARLLSPGTLVEEAAIRREAVIAVAVQDFEAFHRLTSQYFRRYSNSVYAEDFIQRFAVAVSTSKYADDEKLFLDLAKTLDDLAPVQRRSAYLAIAEAGIVRGRVRLTRLTAKKLTELSQTDPTLRLRSKLYEAAVSLVTDKYDEALAQLKSIDPAKLPLRDQAILTAALKLGSGMHLPPQVSGPVSAPPVSAEQGKDAELTQLPKVVDPAKQAINRADELLNGDRR